MWCYQHPWLLSPDVSCDNQKCPAGGQSQSQLKSADLYQYQNECVISAGTYKQDGRESDLRDYNEKLAQEEENLLQLICSGDNK